jgi:2-haloacid dehalogenase
MTNLDFGRFDALTFDCYGTLIDWERGLLDAFQPLLSAFDLGLTPDGLLERYARHEAEIEAGPYRRYRDVVAAAAQGVCAELGVDASGADLAAFADAVGDWPAFEDSAAALRRLATRFRLGVITNCDDDLFARSSRRLGVHFDWVITAQQSGAYKPARPSFDLAFGRIDVPRERILHVAQSLFHDHVPAKALGLTTVWIDRRAGRAGSGATPSASAAPDLVARDMRTFAAVALGDPPA